nr:hypothetical protein KPHV_40510 [Kitasatospora purpeofusca]
MTDGGTMTAPPPGLPATIPTVRVHGRYLGPDGKPLNGTVTFSPPALLTFSTSDVFVAGPVVAVLDEFGRFSVTLPATDAPGMVPDGWAYSVRENLTGVVGSRTYAMLAPKAVLDVDLADIAPADPAAPNYVGVIGPKGDVGPVGPPGVKGDVGPIGATGSQGPKGDTGATGGPGPAGPTGGKFYFGTDVPAGTLGADGDMYIRSESQTLASLVAVTYLSVWFKASGSWTQQGGQVRGNVWYVGTTNPAAAKAGDLLLNPTTGDLSQRGSISWTAVGNLKGPAGPKGDTGPGAFGTKADYDALAGRMSSVEGIVTTLNGYVTDALNRIQGLETRVTALEHR